MRLLLFVCFFLTGIGGFVPNGEVFSDDADKLKSKYGLSLQESENSVTVKQMRNFPAFFIENKGQMSSLVKYYFKGSDTVYFTDDGVVFQKTETVDQKKEERVKDGQNVKEIKVSGKASYGASNWKVGASSRNKCSNLATFPASLAGSRDFDNKDPENISKSDSIRTTSYCLEFVGANHTEPQARKQLKGKINYFKGKDTSKWLRNVATYQEIVYPGLYCGQKNNTTTLTLSRQGGVNCDGYEATNHKYEQGNEALLPAPGGKHSITHHYEGRSDEESGLKYTEGIDLIYKGVQGGMKYDFIVHPGASPDDIKLAYKGIKGLSIDESGNLIIHTENGDVIDEKPYTYQEINGKRLEVATKFKILNIKSKIVNHSTVLKSLLMTKVIHSL